jgi:hypothetical protein
MNPVDEIKAKSEVYNHWDWAVTQLEIAFIGKVITREQFRAAIDVLNAGRVSYGQG